MKKIINTIFTVALVFSFITGAYAAENSTAKDQTFIVNPFPTTKYWMGDFSAYPKADWQFKNQSRVVGAGDVSPEGRSVLEVARKATNSKYDYNVFLTISQMDEIAAAYTPFLMALLQKNKFGVQDTSRMIQRAAWRMGCLYEYSHHVKIAQSIGLKMEEIKTLTMDNSPTWTERTRAIMFVVDDLVAKSDVSDDHWTALKKYYDDKQMIQLIFLIGHYKMVAQLINTIGIPVEDPFFISK